MKKWISALLFLLSFASGAKAQELNAKVTIRMQKLQGVEPKLFENLEGALNQLLNGTKWTEDSYKTLEKIDCAFLLNLTGKSGNVFSGTLTISASRPVFNSSYTSPLVNFIDKDIAFKYEQGQTVQFDPQRVKGSDPQVANLTAIFAYYVNIILGLDYDSFEQGGGTQFFKNAQNIVINAPEEDRIIVGWKSSETNMKNRFYLIDQFLNPRYANFRPYFYVYHRFGMDMMSEKPEEARSAILDGLTNLETISKENPNSVLLQFFFNAKATEYINLLKGLPESRRAPYAARLGLMDISNATKYSEAK